VTGGFADLLLGAALGFSLVVPPGPMNAWIAAASARSFRAGFVTGLGAMTSDAVLGAAVYLLERVVDLGGIVRYVYAVGAVVMAYLGIRLLRQGRSEEGDLGDDRRFLRAWLIGLSNPFQVIWWLTAGVAFAYLGGIVLLVGLFGAIVAWIVAFPLAIQAGTRRRPGVARAARIGSAAILLAFAVYFAALFVLG
jgi:threonine/homoserine/homoserine lactone efflux protein